MILSTEIYKLRYTTRTFLPPAQCYNLSLILLRPRNPYNKSEDSIEAVDQSEDSIEAVDQSQASIHLLLPGTVDYQPLRPPYPRTWPGQAEPLLL